MRDLFKRPTLLLHLTNGAILIGGVLLILILWDPKWNAENVRRIGAFVAAVTGMFVIWQVREELEMERAREAELATASQKADPVLNRKAQQLEEARASRIRQSRLMLVSVIAVWLFAGELLHGFGDLLFDMADQMVAHEAQAQPRETQK